MIKRLTRHLVRPAVERVRHSISHTSAPLAMPTLRLLSFNMQAGMGMGQAHHYLTRSWQHLLPHPQRHEHLERIVQLVRDYDVVALQEVDGGSLRSAWVNQLHHLAERAGFSYCYQQLNRDLGPLGQFSNGLLSRLLPAVVEEYGLPGLRGRGAMLVRYRATAAQSLVVLNLHLALSRQARLRQLDCVAELIHDEPHVVLMGDLNCTPAELAESALGRRDWRWLDDAMPTYPSWRPRRQLDHILVSPSLGIAGASVLDLQLSDHRPLALELTLPAAFAALPIA
jgi:endonuclease/exonuclease/phosphatase family metal-dependent hydrolase